MALWNDSLIQRDVDNGNDHYLYNETSYRVPGFHNGSSYLWNLSDMSTLTPCLDEDGNTTSACVTMDANVTETPGLDCEPARYLWKTILLAILAGSTSLITIVGNIVVIMSFVLERSIRQPTNYFIASLACSDLLIGTLSMPFYTVYLLAGHWWPLGEILCDLWLSIDYTVCLTSIYTVFFITIDRFCMVKIPAKYRGWRTERKVIIMVAFSWLFPVSLFFTSIFGWQYFVGKRSVPPNQCYVQYMEDVVFNTILQICYFWVTLFVMIGLYTGIYKVALDLHKKSAAKHKKMTSLVSMAGQTMTKIGIGMSQQHQAMDITKKMFQNQDTLKPNAKAGATNGKTNTNNNQHSKKLSNTTSFSSTGKDDQERSSSPIYPSDTDMSSQSPNRQQSPKPRRQNKAKNRTSHNGKLRKGKESKQKATLKAVPPPIVPQVAATVTQKPNPPNQISLPPPEDDDNNMCSPVPSLAEDNKTPVYENSALNVDEHCQDNDCDSETAPLQGYKRPRPAPFSTAAAAVATPELLSGLKYIDQESLKSLESNDTIRLLVEPQLNHPDTHIVEEPESPIWKPRDALLSDPDAVEGPRSPIKLSPPPLRAKSSGRQAGSTDVGRKLASVPDYGGVYIAAAAEPLPFPSRQQSRAAPSTEHTMASSSKVDSALIQVDAQTDNTTVSRLAEDDCANSKTSMKGPKRESKHKYKASPLRALLKSNSGRKRRCSQQKQQKKDAGKVQKSKTENRARKALRTITLILGAFVLCWTPWHIMALVISFVKGSPCFVYMLYDVSYWLCYLNSPINPFCYAMANIQFKKTFIRIIKFDWRRK